MCGSRRFVRGPKIRLARIAQVLWFPVARANHFAGGRHWCSRSPSKHSQLPTAAPRSKAQLEIVADSAIPVDRSSRTFSEGGCFSEIEVMISQKLISFQAHILSNFFEAIGNLALWMHRTSNDAFFSGATAHTRNTGRNHEAGIFYQDHGK